MFPTTVSFSMAVSFCERAGEAEEVRRRDSEFDSESEKNRMESEILEQWKSEM